jgi:hypothetical protein
LVGEDVTAVGQLIGRGAEDSTGSEEVGMGKDVDLGGVAEGIDEISGAFDGEGLARRDSRGEG